MPTEYWQWSVLYTESLHRFIFIYNCRQRRCTLYQTLHIQIKQCRLSAINHKRKRNANNLQQVTWIVT